MLDLFYIRSNFQKRYEQAESPARIRLPSRIEAGPRDALMVRAFREGYRRRKRPYASNGQDRIVLSSSRCRTRCCACTCTCGRAPAAFLAKEALTVRVQDGTRSASSCRDRFRRRWSPSCRCDPLRDRVAQLGETCRRSRCRSRPPTTALAPDADELRIYVYRRADPSDGGVMRCGRARRSPVPGRHDAARVFDDALRQQLTRALARALALAGPSRSYLRAATSASRISRRGA
jgi:hypothetical protein